MCGLTEATPLSVFRTQVDAFNAHNLSAFLATYAVDAEIVSGSGAPLVGHDLMSEHYRRRLATPHLRCDVLSVFEVGSRWVVAHELVGDDATSTEVVATFEVEGGVIRRASMMIGETNPRTSE